MNGGLSDVTGQVQSRQRIEDVIRFAKEERLFLMADEVMHINSSASIQFAYVMTKLTQPESTKGDILLSVGGFLLSWLFVLRSTRIMCTKTISFTPSRKCCLRWDQSIPAQWSWPPSTPPPNATWASECPSTHGATAARIGCVNTPSWLCGRHAQP